MFQKTGAALLALAVIFSTVYFGTVFNVPVLSDIGGEIWEEVGPYLKKAWNYTKSFFGEKTLEPPGVSVSIQANGSTHYLGDYPSFDITITNSGGPCEVEYTAFESQPESGSFQLSSNESKTVTETGRQARENGSLNASVDVTATNEEETDQASDWVSVEVNVKPYNPDFSPEWYEDVIVEYSELIRGGIGRIIWGTFSNPANSYEELYVTPDSKTVEKVTNVLINRHPNDRVLKAKEIYYWVRGWITYEGDWEYDITNYHQIELPNETIWDQDGVCLNYALVLASMYKDAGFRVKLVLLHNHPTEDDHAINMLYLPYAKNVRHTPSYPDWVTLDATNSPVFGEIPSWINEYETVYEAEVE